MKLHNLKAPAENKKTRKRVGRGQGSGIGEQSGRGHKGQKAGSGYSKTFGFEGGQMPLHRRIPKFGFTNRFRIQYQPVNIDRVATAIEAGLLSDTITKEDLVTAGLARKKTLVKLLGQGDIDTAVNITVDATSASAKEKIEKAGGSVNLAE